MVPGQTSTIPLKDSREVSATKDSTGVTSMDWKFVLIQGLLLFGIVQVQTLVVGLLAGALMLTVWRRKWDDREAVVALFMLACVLASSREPGLQYWKTLRLIPAALLFLEALKVFRHAEMHQRRSWVKWVMLIVVLTGVPALLSDFVEAGLKETLLLSSMWFAMLVTAHVKEWERLNFRYSSLKHLAIVAIGVSMVYFFVGSGVGFLNGRFRGIFGNPNEMSHWMFPFVLLIVVSNTLSNGREKNLAWIIGLSILGLTGTRGALVALALSWIGMQALKMRSSGLRLLALVSLLLLVVSSQFLSVESLEAYLPERLVRTESLQEGGGRFLAWEYALEEIRERPLFGGGGGHEERYFTSRYHFFAQQNHQGLSHNSWLAFSMNYGVVGSILLVMSLMQRLGLFQKETILLVAPAFLFSLTVEGWLTAPMSSSSPVLFFIGGFLGSKYQVNDISLSQVPLVTRRKITYL